MTTSIDLLSAVYAAIIDAETNAGERVYKPGDWPSQIGQYPIVKLRLFGESRQSLGRGGAQQFTTVATVRIVAEVSEPAQLEDAGATAAETALWALKRQIEVAVVNSYPLEQLIQQIVSMQTELAFNSDAATHLAGLQMDVALEFYEGPESFAPVEADDLLELDATIAAPAASTTISNLGA